MCLLIPILTGLICALLGYLLGKLLSGGNQNNDRIATLEAELKACKASKTSVASAKNSLTSGGSGAKASTSKASTSASSFAASAASVIAFDAAAAKAAFGKKVKENDLTVVEGIGPKIQGLFHNFDIKTWADLAAASLPTCKKVLESGGSRYKMHNPKTWSKQAGLAAKGEWKKLKKLQDELDGGL